MSTIQFSRVSLVLEDDNGLIRCLNLNLPYFSAVFGTLSNAFLLIAYIKRENKAFYKYFIPYTTLSNQLCITLFALNNIAVSAKQTSFVNHSVFTCKLMSYLFHLISTYNAWSLVSFNLIIILWVKRSITALEKTRLAHAGLFVTLALVYSIDLVYMDVSDADEVMCILKTEFLLLRDILDFLLFFVLPFVFILVNLSQLDSSQETFRKMKTSVPLAFALFQLPVILCVLVRDLEIVFKFQLWSNPFWMDLLFAFSQWIFYSNSVIVAIFDIYFVKHSRYVFYELVNYSYVFRFILPRTESETQAVPPESMPLNLLA